MPGIIKYRFRGEEITIAKAAELAGVEPKTISTRLREDIKRMRERMASE